MKSEADIFYQAMLARDYRFDGKFFTGVKTTGIYCRPICPAKPKRQNVEFFRDAVSAEKAGYRPCLRCRPEAAPLSPAWIGKSVIVQRALRLIANQRAYEMGEEEFAGHLGVSSRHLRRLFDEEIGKTPKQIADSGRLDFARKLLVETKVPITEIAFVAGFSSIRRFNDAVQKRFSRSPREIRRSSSAVLSGDETQISLSYRPPFDWESLLRFYQGHAIRGVESVTSDSYQRVFRLDGQVGGVSIKNDPQKSRLILEITPNQTSNLWKIAQAARQMFDLDSDPLLIANGFSQCSLLGELVVKYPGLRLPRGWNGFETAICSILGQLVSTEQAGKLIGQLVREYGQTVENPYSSDPAYLFPEAKVLAKENLAKLGTTLARKNTIREFSKLVLEKKVSLDSVQDPLSFRQSLLAIKGIGPWTAEYISLRVLGDTNAFPKSDLILKRVLEQHPEIQLEALKPWSGYAAMYLWKEFAPLLTRKKVKKNEPLL